MQNRIKKYFLDEHADPCDEVDKSLCLAGRILHLIENECQNVQLGAILAVLDELKKSDPLTAMTVRNWLEDPPSL